MRGGCGVRGWWVKLVGVNFLLFLYFGKMHTISALKYTGTPFMPNCPSGR